MTKVLLYAIDMDGCRADLQSLIDYARTALPDVAIKGAWLDQHDDVAMTRRRGGIDLLDQAKRGDHLVVPDIGVLARPLADLYRTVKRLAETEKLTIHFVAEAFVYGRDGDTERLKALAKQSHRRWWERRVREGWEAWKARPDKVTGWPAYGTHVVIRNGKRIVEACWWERKWIALAVELHRSGMSLGAITKELKRRNAKTSRGTEWAYERVWRVIRWKLAEEACGGTFQPGEFGAPLPEPLLCEAAASITPCNRRTSDKPETFEVDGIPVKLFSKPLKTAAERSKDLRQIMQLMRAIIGRPRPPWRRFRIGSYTW